MDHRWPYVDQLIYYLQMKGPFRPDHPTGAIESVRCDIGRAHDELRQETDTENSPYDGNVLPELRRKATEVVLSQNRATDRSTNKCSKAFRPY